MRTSVVVILSLVLGAALGYGANIAHFSGITAPLASTAGKDARQPDFPKANEPKPLVELAATDFDFGVMEQGTSLSHTFEIRNVGKAPLTLQQGDTTCKCTISELEHGQIAPNSVGNVTMKWEAKTPSGQFRQSATIFTNDPSRPRLNLTVHGNVTESLAVIPSDLVFSAIPSGEKAETELRLVAYLVDDMQVVEHKFLDLGTSEFFRCEVRPIAPGSATFPLNAKSAAEVIVTVLPGLPAGPFTQRLELKTNIKDAVREIPISGRITSEISIYGPGWNAELAVLTLGSFRRGEGKKQTVSLFVRGKDVEKTEIRVASHTPDFLRVTLGEQKKLDNVIQIPLTVEAPPDSPVSNYLGSEDSPFGEIVLETNHPKAKQLKINVRFIIEN